MKSEAPRWLGSDRHSNVDYCTPRATKVLLHPNHILPLLWRLAFASNLNMSLTQRYTLQKQPRNSTSKLLGDDFFRIATQKTATFASFV